jgi:hypothetical protein
LSPVRMDGVFQTLVAVVESIDLVHEPIVVVVAAAAAARG